MSSTLAIAEEPVISGTTDKTDYTGTETITETVELNNASDRDIESITITGEIPEGYSAKIVSENGTANDDEWTVKDAAAAGEKASAVVELTPAEKELIETLREIDRQNPAGIDNYTEASHLAMCITIAAGGVREARKHYQLFLDQSKNGNLIDLREAQRSKHKWDDPRGV